MDDVISRLESLLAEAAQILECAKLQREQLHQKQIAGGRYGAEKRWRPETIGDPNSRASSDLKKGTPTPLPDDFELNKDRFDFALLFFDGAGLFKPDDGPEQQAELIERTFNKFRDTARQTSERQIDWDSRWRAYCRAIPNRL